MTQGDAHRLRPLQRRRARRPATGTRTRRSTPPARRATAAQEGFRFAVQYGVGQVVPETANGLECGTCHDEPRHRLHAIIDVPSVTFPSGVVRKEPGNDNVCESCHRGREAQGHRRRRDRGGQAGFMNVHYLPAGRDQAGLGRPRRLRVRRQDATPARCRTSGGTQCTSCHDPVASHHTFQITDAWDATCRTCHADAERRPEEHPPHPHRRLRRRRQHHRAAGRRDRRAGGALLAAMQARAAAPGLC